MNSLPVEGRPAQPTLPLPLPLGQRKTSDTRATVAYALDDRLRMLDLDTFSGSERFMSGTTMGAAFAIGMRLYLNARYQEAVNEFKTALIAAYVEGDEFAQMWDRERAIIHLYLGNCYANLDFWAMAFNEYMNTIQIDSQLAEAHYNLGVAFRANGKIVEAIAAFKVALQHNPDLYEARFALGRTYHELGDYAHAYIAYTVARQYRPLAAEPIYYQGLLHQAHGEEKQAARCFAEALRVEPDYKFNKPTTPTGELEADIDDPNWYYRLADELKGKGNTLAALRAYESLLQRDPQQYRARYFAANILARQRHWPQAIRQYHVVLAAAPDFVPARHKLALALRAATKLREAYNTLIECARQQPDDGSIFLSLGIVVGDLGFLPHAIRCFARAARLLPNDPQVFYRLGRALISVGQDEEALAAWQHAVALDGEWQEAHYDLGVLYLRNDYFAQAISEFEQVLRAQPDDLDALYFLAVAYKESGRLEEAVTMFQQVIANRHQHVMAHFHLGATYLRLGHPAEGLHHIRTYEGLKVAAGQKPITKPTAMLDPNKAAGIGIP